MTLPYSWGKNSIIILNLVLFLALPAHKAYAVITNLCSVSHPSDSKIDWACVRIKQGESLEKLFGDRWIDIARFNRVDRRHAYPWVRIKVPKNLDDIKDFSPMPKTYSPAGQEAKFILLDVSEQFLGAYENGRLVFSVPITTGREYDKTPLGVFSISAYDSRHISSLYFIENTEEPYPMHYALRFFIKKNGVSFWMHGRDVPGYPVSHGCIGLYDEEMQKRYYGYPKDPVLKDAKTLFDWVISPAQDDGRFHRLDEGPQIKIIGDILPLSR